MISNIQVNYYNDSTITKEILENAFSKINNQALNKVFVEEAVADAYCIDSIFFYHNERLPDTPVEDDPLCLSLQKDNDLFPDDESNIFSGPHGAVGEILGVKPFKDINVCEILVRTLKRLFPSAIVGTDNHFVYFNSQTINIPFWPEKGVLILRIQSLDLSEDSEISYVDVVQRMFEDLIQELEYEN